MFSFLLNVDGMVRICQDARALDLSTVCSFNHCACRNLQGPLFACGSSHSHHRLPARVSGHNWEKLSQSPGDIVHLPEPS